MTIIAYLQVTGRPSCGREIIAIMTADDSDLNIGFKQFVIAVQCGRYAATKFFMTVGDVAYSNVL